MGCPSIVYELIVNDLIRDLNNCKSRIEVIFKCQKVKKLRRVNTLVAMTPVTQHQTATLATSENKVEAMDHCRIALSVVVPTVRQAVGLDVVLLPYHMPPRLRHVSYLKRSKLPSYAH